MPTMHRFSDMTIRRRMFMWFRLTGVMRWCIWIHWKPSAAQFALAALSDPSLFARAGVGARGGYMLWIDGGLEILRRPAIEQASGIGRERLWEWMRRNSLTQERAAEAIGISRRMLNCCLSGEKPIPKTVWLARLGAETELKCQNRHGGKCLPADSRVAA